MALAFISSTCFLNRERALRKDGSEKEEAPREERERRRERSRWVFSCPFVAAGGLG